MEKQNCSKQIFEFLKRKVMEKGSSVVQLDFLREDDATRIIKRISPFSYVSFDIFDTLLKRDVLHPTDIFRLVGQQNQDALFAQKRIAAERNLRKDSGKEEITLDEIYDILGEKYKPYKEQELALEKALLYQNPVLRPVYEYCINHGKKIIVVSDMYLPEQFLKDVLYRQGIKFDFCFISSSYGVKKITGNLFRTMLSEIKISPKEVIHIGDSARGDYMGAHNAVIKSILIPKIINRTKWVNLKNEKQQTAFNVFINNHLDTSRNLYYQLGYAYFGPVIFGFVRWLHNAVGDRKIFFFARDGHVVKKVYNALYPDAKTDYIYLSRRALSVPLLWMHSGWDEFFRYITVTRFFTVRILLERLGLDPNKYQRQVQRMQLSLDSILQQKDFLQNEKLRLFYQSIRGDIVQNSRNEFDCLAVYFKEKHFHGRIAVMDIGWNGSMQRYLEELMDTMGISISMEGYYFGMRRKVKNTQVYGYLYEPSKMHLEPRVSFMQGLFESFFLSREGSTMRYSIQEGKAVPVLCEPEYNENDVEFLAFQDLQNGAIQFCKEYAKSAAANLTNYTAKEYCYALLRFGTAPTLKEVDLFGDFRFYDTEVFPLAKPKSLVYYMRNPKKFAHDFSCSAWKSGFIKRCFKVDAPYFYLYYLLKTRH